jgi:MarR family
VHADRRWTLLSNHGHVLVCIARDPTARLRDIAAEVGITERSVSLIVTDLVAAGMVRRERIGRRSRYQVVPDRPMRHPLEAAHPIGDLLAALDVAGDLDPRQGSSATKPL